uniref:small monomeric GTPase n=1 Tax=Xenopus tropicalis TaxID=8364 RepID=A0A803JV74_XENTR
MWFSDEMNDISRCSPGIVTGRYLSPPCVFPGAWQLCKKADWQPWSPETGDLCWSEGGIAWLNDEDVRLMLWDTAGQEEFDAITKAYYRGAQACVLVFSTTDRESFETIPSWREKVVAEVGDIPTVLVQNKIDLLDETVIKNEEAEALAKRLKLRFYRTSVKEDLNVTEVFKYLADKYLQRLKRQTAEDNEVVHTTSNKIGVFNTAGGSHSGQKTNGLNGSGDVINLRPNKQRTKKTKSPFTNCNLI